MPQLSRDNGSNLQRPQPNLKLMWMFALLGIALMIVSFMTEGLLSGATLVGSMVSAAVAAWLVWSYLQEVRH